MRVYILDRQGKSREQMQKWLSEDKRITGVEAFGDYIQFIEQTEKSPPDFCIIRLGWDGIPGLKTADMVRQISPDIRIVFVSDDRDYAVDAYEVGAYGYLLCPVEKKRLDKCLNVFGANTKISRKESEVMEEMRIRRGNPLGKRFALLMALVLATAMLPVTAAAVGDEGSITGRFDLASAPEIGSLVILTVGETPEAPLYLTPQQDYDIKLTVNNADGLGELQNLIIKLWFDSSGVSANKNDFDNQWQQISDRCVNIVWDRATGNTTITSDSGSTWQIIDSTVPTGGELDLTSFEFIFRFRVGKVAWATVEGEKWQIGALARKNEYLYDYMHYEVGGVKGLPMNWYGEVEISPGMVLDWGTIPPGIDFSAEGAMKSTYSDLVNYKSNGGYNQQIKSDTEWKDSVNENIKVSLSADATAADTFALKAYASHLTHGNTIEHTNGVLLDPAGGFVTLKSDGTRTTEGGDSFNDNRLWIKLGPSITTPTVYSGKITFGIVNR